MIYGKRNLHMSNTRPPRGSDQYPLRLPEGLRDRIKQTADDNGRSMNAEIVAALLEAFPEPARDVAPLVAVLEYVNGAPDDAGFFARVAEINERLSATGADYALVATRSGRASVVPKD